MRRREMRVGMPVRHKRTLKPMGTIHTITDSGLARGYYTEGVGWIAHPGEIEPDRIDGPYLPLEPW